MGGAAVYHRATDSFCYSPDGTSLVIRLQCAADDISSIQLWAGDPHDWGRRPEADGGTWHWRCAPTPVEKIGTDGIRDFWEVRWTPPYKRARYFFRITFADGSMYDYGEKGLIKSGAEPEGSPAGDYWNAFVFPYINDVDVYRAPEWVAGTIWYQIFPERFRNGNTANDPAGTKPWQRGHVSNHEFYGGDLRGIIEGLDHIASLGCTGIYLTPIFTSPSVHKYDTEDYLKIDPAFGTEEDLKELVKECHKRGIRLMLDAVFNHCGKTFGPWKDVVEKGEQSRYKDWFHINAFPLFPKGKDTGDSRDANFETFAFTTRMPKFNTTNPEVKEYLLSVAEYYIKECDIDGWRLDVSNEIDHAFWREFRQRVKAAKPDAYIVGEIWHDALPWLRGEQYDAVMNYPFGTAITDYLLTKPWSPTAADLVHRINSISFMYPHTVLRSAFNLLDSHDTDRLVTRMGSREKAKLALTLLFALPGSPCIYYGTEYALEGGHDPDCRRCMIWDPKPDEHAFFRFVASLVKLRREYWQVFGEGKRTYRTDPAHPGLLVINLELEKTYLHVLINRDEKPVQAETWKALAGHGATTRVRSLLDQAGLGPGDELSGTGSVVLLVER
ncbi:glycoside hydrolase family 13 protein [Gracilinema caldarium]|uniref:glycoside hydrolase family 13 protein n=1 Tax=Gracilinema caldarium TaxID=215591 RepID=UPI0026F14185|nr:glycoside hydrolase family 13 protein [Gracilinema caldarium]